MSDDRLGVSGELPDTWSCCRMGRGCQHYIVCLSAAVVDDPPRGEDEQTLHEHLSDDWGSIHECESTRTYLDSILCVIIPTAGY